MISLSGPGAKGRAAKGERDGADAAISQAMRQTAPELQAAAKNVAEERLCGNSADAGDDAADQDPAQPSGIKARGNRRYCDFGEDGAEIIRRPRGREKKRAAAQGKLLERGIHQHR